MSSSVQFNFKLALKDIPEMKIKLTDLKGLLFTFD